MVLIRVHHTTSSRTMTIASFAAAARLRHLSSSSSHLSASEMISQATTFTSTSPSNKENGTQQPIMIVPRSTKMRHVLGERFDFMNLNSIILYDSS